MDELMHRAIRRRQHRDRQGWIPHVVAPLVAAASLLAPDRPTRRVREPTVGSKRSFTGTAPPPIRRRLMPGQRSIVDYMNYFRPTPWVAPNPKIRFIPKGQYLYFGGRRRRFIRRRRYRNFRRY